MNGSDRPMEWNRARRRRESSVSAPDCDSLKLSTLIESRADVDVIVNSSARGTSVAARC